MRARTSLSLLLLLVLVPAAPAWSGPDEVDPAPYTRLDDRGDHLVLEIASREFLPTDPGRPRVWLVGAVHIADAAYYAATQELLDGLDLVLYESVKPAGAGSLRDESAENRIADTRRRLRFLAGIVRRVQDLRGASPASLNELAEACGEIDARLADFVAAALLDAWGHALVYVPSAPGAPDAFVLRSLGADGREGGQGEAADLEAGPAEGDAVVEEGLTSSYNLQRELAVALDLSWQAKGIDYARAHFTPSDMDLDELTRAIERRGGDVAFLDRALAGGGLSGVAARFLIGALKLGRMLSGGRLAVIVKMVLVSTLAEPALQEGRIEGVDEGTMKAVLIDRNGVVLEDLDALLAVLGTAKTQPRIGVFYGAAHMSDFERRLRERGYEPGETRWIPAIDVDLEATGLDRARLERMRDRIARALRARVAGD